MIGESIFLLLGLLRDSKGKRGVMSDCNAIIFCMRMYIGISFFTKSLLHPDSIGWMVCKVCKRDDPWSAPSYDF